MNNLVRWYKANVSLTTTPQVVLDHPTEVFNVVRFENLLAVDVIVNFAENDTSAGFDFLVLAGEDFMQPFQCTGRVSLRVSEADVAASGDFFVRLTRG